MSAAPAKQHVKLYTKAKFMGYQRNIKYQKRQCSLLKLEGVTCKADTDVRSLATLARRR
jgi:ribosomal protein L35AE/L33A